jgi:hypothetical protein
MNHALTYHLSRARIDDLARRANAERPAIQAARDAETGRRRRPRLPRIGLAWIVATPKGHRPQTAFGVRS